MRTTAMEKNIFSRRDFVKNSVLAATAFTALNGSLLSNAHAMNVKQKQTLLSSGKWENWGGNISFTPKKAYTPKTIQEASEIIKANKKIRVSGSGHSWSALVPSEVIIYTTHFNAIKINKKELWVDVGSGVVLEDLITVLKQHDLAFASTGEIDQQTVAGLVSTGTRGTGVNFASFSDKANLLGVSIILPNGVYKEFDFSTSPDDDLFRALRLGLGAFGMVTSVKFRLRPTFNLQEDQVSTTLTEALKEKNIFDSYRYSFYYYPFSDLAVMRKQNLTNKPIATESERKKRKRSENLKENILANLLLDFASLIPSSIPWMVNKFASALKDESFVDTWDNVMITKRTMRYNEMNYILPVENLKEALSRCRTKALAFADRNEYCLPLPIYVRFARADEGTLISPSGEEAGVYAHIDLNFHHAVRNYQSLAKSLEKDFLELGGRPHWGKLFYESPTRLYSNVGLFESLRKEIDPTGKFQNEFIKTHISG